MFILFDSNMAISITGSIAGFLTAELLHKVANRMDRKDKEIQNHLENDNFEAAIEVAAENQTTLDKFYQNLTEIMSNDNDFNEDDISKIEQYRNQHMQQL